MPRFVPIAGEDPMSTYCRMVVETKFEDLPAKVVNYAKYSIMDTVAVTIGGSAMEGIPAVVDLVKSNGGKPESLIPFYGGRVPAAEAGLAIGPMSRAMDLGDVHEEAGHTSEYTLPTLLAATGLKHKTTGKELITAFTLGQEIQIRIAIASKKISRGISYRLGEGQCIFGTVAAAGKLLNLNLDELMDAQGIARAMTQPRSFTMFSTPTLIVRVHHGFVCQDSINACILAKRGITGPHDEILLGPGGYLNYAKWDIEPQALTERLGEKWEMTGTMMKPYPSCKCTHTSVAGILDLLDKHHIQLQDIVSINLEESKVNIQVCGATKEKWDPRTIPECQFSLPFTVASAALDKELFLNSYNPLSRSRKDVYELMNKISIKEDSDLPPYAARVSILIKDGRKFSITVSDVKGHPKHPFTEQDLTDKFKRCVQYSAYALSDSKVDSVISALLKLEDVDDIEKEILIPLTPDEI